MRVIGLTGSIACGKSTVSGWLKDQPDCRIIDADQLSRRLTAPGGPALPLLREAFGDAVFLSDGSLNRRRLGSIVFSDSSVREKLDALMAPLLAESTRMEIERAGRDGIALCFLDYPLLFEKGYDTLCDSVWCVTLPPALQLQRLMARDHLAEEEALARMNAVLSSEEKARRSSVIIDNSGSLSYTLSLLPSLLAEERQKTGSQAPVRRRRSDRYAAPAPSEEPRLRSWQREETPAVPASVPVPAPAQAPPVLDRPQSSRKGPSARKIQWRLPSWLMIIQIVCVSLLLIGITVQCLMAAFLTRQTEKHRSDAQAILLQYPVEYRDMIESTSSAFNLNPSFVTAIIRNESSFQPRAESGVGARGLMQLMPDTAEWIARKMKYSGYAFDRMYDPESNIRFGCWYLSYLASLFHGDPVCVACAYHAGQGQVNAWLSDSLLSDDGVTLKLDRMPDGPTKNYARRVIKAYGIYQTLYFDGADAFDVLLPRPGQ